MADQVSQDEDRKLECDQPPSQGIKRKRGDYVLMGINPLANPKSEECRTRPGAETTIPDQVAKPSGQFDWIHSIPFDLCVGPF